MNISGFSTLFRRKKASNEDGTRASTTRTSTSFLGVDHNDYHITELKRTRVFEHSEHKRELEFLQAEITRRQPEDARNEQFNQFLDEMMDIFWKGQKERGTAFEIEQDKQEEFFRSKEDMRNESFEKLQTKREEVFQKAQEHHRRISEWYFQSREGPRKKGRDERAKIYNELIQYLQDQFDQFLKGEEDAFVAAQRRREDNLYKHKMQMGQSTKPNFEGNQTMSPVETPEDVTWKSLRGIGSPPIPPEPRPDPFVSPIQTNGFRPELPPLTIHPRSRSPSVVYPSPSPMIIAQPSPILQQSSVPASPDLDAESSYSLVLAQPITVSQPHPPSYFESDFQLRQEERGRIFEEAQRKREARFEQLETQRSAAYQERESRFGIQQNRCRDLFQKSCNSFGGSFGDHQASRDQGKDLRAKSFLTLQSRLEGIFERDLLWYVKQYEAEERITAAEVTAQKEWVLLLFKDMQGVVDHTREKFSAAFTAAIIKWGVRIVEEEVSTGEVFTPIPVPPEIFERYSSSQLRVVNPQPLLGTATCMMPSESISTGGPRIVLMRSRSSLSELNVPGVIHAYAPDDLFVPQTLFQRGIITTNLPLPVDNKPFDSKKSTSSSLQRFQIHFKASESDRANMFRVAAQNQQYQFSVNEHKRQLEFVEQLTRCRQLASDQEREWSQEFAQNQESRRQTFFSREGQRAREEAEAEQNREKDFAEGQMKRSKDFHELQETLQSKRWDFESVELSEFRDWRDQMKQELSSGLKVWRDVFAELALQQDKLCLGDSVF